MLGHSLRLRKFFIRSMPVSPVLPNKFRGRRMKRASAAHFEDTCFEQPSRVRSGYSQ